MAVAAEFRVVTKKKKKESSAVIRPAFGVAKKPPKNENQILIHNKTKADMIVAVPGDLFGTGGNPDPAQNVPVAPGNHLTLDVHKNAIEGIFEFQVFCLETFSFAEANSDPEIIIEA